jgi:hypothetical protein
LKTLLFIMMTSADIFPCGRIEKIWLYYLKRTKPTFWT